jgi:putative phosphoribosyl transferase
MPFRDRLDAGRRLAAEIVSTLPADADTVVLGLPRGGVPVAGEVATALGAPLDVILVRKVGVPSQPELAMGAVGEEGVRVVNTFVRRRARIPNAVYAAVEASERSAIERRASIRRAEHPRIDLRGRRAVVVDDGIATGSTARAACLVARAHGARRVVIAAPVAPPETVAELRTVADDVVVVEQPARFHAIGRFYADFSPTRDDEMRAVLRRHGPARGERES